MKIKTILIAALAFTFTQLTGCSESDNEHGGKLQSVKIKIEESAPVGRAVGDPVGTNPVTFTDGHLFFVSSTGQITKHMTISNSGTTTDAHINLTDLKSTNGVEVKNVTDNSREVYIIANVPDNVTVPTNPVNLNISIIEEMIILVEKLSDGSGGVTKIPLYGKGTINTTPTPATVTVKVEAISSRIEIVKFDLKPGAEIATYQIDGIFINAYYKSMLIDGTVTSANMVNNGTENDANTKYIGDGGMGLYPTSLPLWDYKSSGGIGNLVGTTYSPAGTNKVWAYNVFPGAPAPHIIVRLSGVKYKDGFEMADPQFLTARTYNNKAIDTFVKGTAYKIESFLFDENDLTDKPELGDMDVKVTVNIVDWVTSPVTPDL